MNLLPRMISFATTVVVRGSKVHPDVSYVQADFF